MSLIRTNVDLHPKALPVMIRRLQHYASCHHYQHRYYYCYDDVGYCDDDCCYCYCCCSISLICADELVHPNPNHFHSIQSQTTNPMSLAHQHRYCPNAEPETVAVAFAAGVSLLLVAKVAKTAIDVVADYGYCCWDDESYCGGKFVVDIDGSADDESDFAVDCGDGCWTQNLWSLRWMAFDWAN